MIGNYRSSSCRGWRSEDIRRVWFICGLTVTDALEVCTKYVQAAWRGAYFGVFRYERGEDPPTGDWLPGMDITVCHIEMCFKAANSVDDAEGNGCPFANEQNLERGQALIPGNCWVAFGNWCKAGHCVSCSWWCKALVFLRHTIGTNGHLNHTCSVSVWPWELLYYQASPVFPITHRKYSANTPVVYFPWNTNDDIDYLGSFELYVCFSGGLCLWGIVRVQVGWPILLVSFGPRNGILIGTLGFAISGHDRLLRNSHSRRSEPCVQGI